MKRTVFSIILLGSFLLFMGDIYSQEVILSGELRPRYEYQHGYKTLFPDNQTAANFVSQRSRLNAYYASSSFSTYLSIQNVRVWGDVNQLNVQDVNGFAIHEAWGEIKFYDFLYFKIGRQEISYDDQRIFGAVNWAQQARSHDAAIFKFAFGKKNKLDMGFAYNAMGESLYKVNYTLANYKTIQWLHYHGDFGKSGLSFLFLNNGFAFDNNPDTTVVDQKVAFSQTIGPRYTYDGDKIDVSAAVYYQGGKNG